MAAQKLKALRIWMKKQKLDAYIIPHADRFQSEYLAPRDERLAWLTGFTGSNGIAIITAKKAYLFTDSRYTLQAATETDKKLYQIIIAPPARPNQFLCDLLKAKQRVGIDPMLFTVQQAAQWQQACSEAKAQLVGIVENPIDLLWTDRPTENIIAAEAHALKYAGESKESKLKRVIAQMHNEAQRILISDPTLVCWLLNIRGRDVAHVPVLLSTALVDRKGHTTLFTDPRKITPALKKTLGSKVTIVALDKMLTALTANKTALQLDPAQAPLAVQQALAAKNIIIYHDSDPCIIMRACKNPVEIKGAMLAHKKDAVAMKKFLAWFAKRDFAHEKLTEIDIAEKLYSFRAQDPDFIDTSFDTIAGFASNGAIVHYHATPATAKRLVNGNLLLLDSGGQYRCGTTDITRVLAVGKPTAEMKKHYQLVYSALQKLSVTRFPVGTTGAQLEAIARRELWAEGLDYGHGTGHGVGSFLSVHEGPAGFSPRSHTPLMPGMILSIEPGVYHTCKFGIRLENLVVVVEDKHKGDMKPMLAFKTLTDVPFDKNLLR